MEELRAVLVELASLAGGDNAAGSQALVERAEEMVHLDAGSVDPTELLEAADELSALAPKLAAAWECVDGGGFSASEVGALRMQLAAALFVAHHVVDVAHSIEGPVATAVASALGRCVTLLLTCCRLELASHAAGHFTIDDMALVLKFQLRLAGSLLHLLPVHVPQGLQNCLPQEPFVSWLQAVAGAAVPVLHPSLGAGAGAEERAEVLAALAALLHQLLSASYFAQHAAIIAAPLRHSLLEMFVGGLRQATVMMQLPSDRRPKHCSWLAVMDMAAAACDDVLRDEFAAHIGQPAPADAGMTLNGQRLVQCASKLLALAPSDDPESEPRPSLLLFHLLRLLSASCVHVCESIDLLQQSGSWHWGERPRRLAPSVLAAIQRLPLVLQTLMGDPQLRGSELATDLCQAMLTVVTMLGKLATAQPARDNGDTAVVNLADLTAWCGAATSQLRALPHVAAIVQRLEEVPELQASVVELALYLAQSAELSSNVCSTWKDREMQGVLPADSVATAQAALWDLHTTACRLAHFMATSEGRILPSLQQRAKVLGIASTTLRLAVQLQLRLAAGQTNPPRSLKAMGAAHCEALCAVAASDDAQLLEGSVGVAGLLVPAMAMAPALLALRPSMQDLLARVMQSVMDPADRCKMHSSVIPAATWSPRLAAHLMESGALHAALVELGSMARSRHPWAPLVGPKVGFYLPTVLKDMRSAAADMLAAIDANSTTSSGSGGSSGSNSTSGTGTGPSLRRHLAALEAAIAQLPQEKQQWTAAATPALLRRCERHALPPACQLSGALLEWWQRPEQAVEDQMELAQVAAARSCAYLHCCQLSGEGGPAAGQGVGGRKCSRCRTVWYCGTACSHADWRAGHTRVCAALGAARQAERQAAREARQQAEEAA